LCQGSPSIAKVQFNGGWHRLILGCGCRSRGWWQEACSICQQNWSPHGSLLEMNPRIQKTKEGVALQRHKLVWMNSCFCCHGDNGTESPCTGLNSK
jgi:hypothetical protein